MQQYFVTHMNHVDTMFLVKITFSLLKKWFEKECDSVLSIWLVHYGIRISLTGVNIVADLSVDKFNWSTTSSCCFSVLRKISIVKFFKFNALTSISHFPVFQCLCSIFHFNDFFWKSLCLVVLLFISIILILDLNKLYVSVHSWCNPSCKWKHRV